MEKQFPKINSNHSEILIGVYHEGSDYRVRNTTFYRSIRYLLNKNWITRTGSNNLGYQYQLTKDGKKLAAILDRAP